ncbi:hypothetical protein WN51_07577 [Melipona quadrifasciata]|uniref:Uncharacterized protein n=1 Tax=Melipona quadrifasciata TaxID=166423 RepID=A0A0M9A8N5_9HYME|nr:hypothetical protein WN51_07577 [Melipona quadrifasciata]
MHDILENEEEKKKRKEKKREKFARNSFEKKLRYRLYHWKQTSKRRTDTTFFRLHEPVHLAVTSGGTGGARRVQRYDREKERMMGSKNVDESIVKLINNYATVSNELSSQKNSLRISQTNLMEMINPIRRIAEKQPCTLLFARHIAEQLISSAKQLSNTRNFGKFLFWFLKRTGELSSSLTIRNENLRSSNGQTQWRDDPRDEGRKRKFYLLSHLMKLGFRKKAVRILKKDFDRLSATQNKFNVQSLVKMIYGNLTFTSVSKVTLRKSRARNSQSGENTNRGTLTSHGANTCRISSRCVPIGVPSSSSSIMERVCPGIERLQPKTHVTLNGLAISYNQLANLAEYFSRRKTSIATWSKKVTVSEKEEATLQRGNRPAKEKQHSIPETRQDKVIKVLEKAPWERIRKERVADHEYCLSMTYLLHNHNHSNREIGLYQVDELGTART